MESNKDSMEGTIEARKAKVIVVVNSASPDFSRFFLRAVFRNMYLDITAIIDSARTPNERQRRFPLAAMMVEMGMELLKRVFNRGYDKKRQLLFFQNIYFIARGRRRDILPVNDLNDPAFIEKASALKADLVLLLGCPQILKKGFIEKFPFIVNFHDSLLPAYRGLDATIWSVYRDERETGFTFHLVDENIDTGKVLYQQGLTLQKGDWNIQQILFEKCRRAGEYLESTDILSGLRKVTGSEEAAPAEKKRGVSSYFGNKEFRSMVTILNPTDHSYSELEKRIKIFGYILLPESHNNKKITGIRFSRSGGIPVSDGYIVITRVAFLPRRLAAIIFRR
jgi:methionyl-tRNA formyltransferase